MSIIEGAQAFQALKDMALTAGSVFFGGARGFIQGVQMAGQSAISSIETTAVGATNTERLVKVGHRTARLLKTEGSHALVEFLDSGFQSWVHQRDYEPLIKEQPNRGASTKDMLMGGLKGAVGGAIQGLQRRPKTKTQYFPFY